MYIGLFTLVLTVFLVVSPPLVRRGGARAECPQGDLNEDCEVNLQDVQVLAEQWLDPPGSSADLSGDEQVGMADFALLAKYWTHTALPLVINEFMASNSIIQDWQGEYEDWIEIHNVSDDAIDIGGMYLTDDLSIPTKWQIPEDVSFVTTIPGHGYLLIWADNDTGDAGLHANFQLNVGGEELGLFDTDGKTLIDSIIFGDQIADLSYGRYPNASTDWRFMVFPTPGGENIGIYEGFAADPEFSHDSRVCDKPFSVAIRTKTEGATIYYTVDGSSPFNDPRGLPTGRVYSGSIAISRTTTLRAVTWKAGWRQSGVETQRYIFMAADAQSFISKVPIAVVDTLGQSVGGTTQTQTLSFAWFIDTDIDGRARLADTPNFSERSGINIRGKSSRGFPKKQYHFETLDEHNQDTDVSILGFPPGSDWVLQGPYSDKSLMRNFLSYKWSNDIGRYAVRSRFVEMFLNTDHSGISMSDYVGVYVFMEKIGQGEDRVDIAKLEPSDNAEPQISGGYIIKKDKFDSGEPSFSTSTGQRLIYEEPPGDEITQAQKNWIKSYLDAFESVLYGSNFTDPIDGYAKYIDVDSFIDHHIIVELTKNIDGFRLSTYMFKDRGGKLNMGPVWDYNLSLGNANYLDGWKPDGWYYNLLGNSEYPWWRRLFEDPEFRLRYADRWFGFRQKLLATDRLIQNVDDAAGLLDEAQVRNFQRWPILGRYVWPNWYIANTYQQEINWMKGWIEDRLIWMDREIGREFAAAPPVFNQQGGHVTEGFNLTMAAPYGTIYYTLDGADPRLSEPSGGGTISSTTLVVENADKRVLVPARAISDAWKGGGAFDDSAWALSTGSPGGVGYERNSGYEGLINIDIGDQMYNKNTTCYIRIPFTVDADDLAGFNFMTLEIRYDDGFVAYINGVEIDKRNFTGTPAWNSNASALNDDSAAVMFESVGVSEDISALQAGANILAIHALNYNLSSSDLLVSLKLIAGETGVPNDSGASPTAIRYTAPVTLSETTQVKARALSGSTWSALNDAIFGVGPVAENLRVTEIMYHPQDANDPNDEFIELQNIGIETINLNLVRFTNGIYFTFPSMELAAGEYVLVVKDISAFAAQYGLGFNIAGQYSGSLRNSGERIELEDAAGESILNFRYRDGWYDITDGMGFSLTVKEPVNTEPNAWNDKSTWRPSANIGGSPGWDDSGEIPALGSVKINEILAHAHAEAPDWIELHNTTSAPIHIGGWFFSDDNDDFMKYEIADGTWIDPCDYIVFYQNEHFGNIADPGCHSSFALSENGETLYLHSGRDGALTGYSEEEKFGASETAVAFGRYEKSTGTYNFIAMSENTPGVANAYPKVGPVVINEIMYHPYNDGDAEYVELLNISLGSVVLQQWDNEQTKFVPWRFTDEGGISFDFPLGTVVAAGEHILLVRNLLAFWSEFGAVGGGVKVFEWGVGKLDNGGEKIQLSKPGDEVDGERHYIRVDRVNYSDGSHPVGDDPWPIEADGSGSSLARKEPSDYGNDIINWEAAFPSPGVSNP